MNSKSMATTFKGKPFPSKSRPPNRFVDRFIPAPDKIPDEELVMQLFSVVSNGNFFEINKFIINNDMTLTALDGDNNSLLHNVLNNTNLDSEEKTELAIQLINRGAPVDGHNKQNVVPMHLASKYQLGKIIKILHEKGASLNSVDTNGMTPAHYVARPDGSTCINTSIEKDRLIKDNVVNLDDNNGENTKIILETVRKYLDSTEGKNAKYLIDNLKKTLLDVNVNATPDILKQLDSTYAKIEQKIAAGTKAGDTLIQELKRDTASKIQDILTKRLSQATSNIYNSGATWAPDDTQQIPLLPFHNISDGLLELKSSIKNNLNTLKNEYSNTNKIIGSKLLEFNKSMSNLSNIFNNLLMVIAITHNTNVGPANKLTNLAPNPNGVRTMTEANIINLKLKTLYTDIFAAVKANGDGTDLVKYIGLNILDINTDGEYIADNRYTRDICNIIFTRTPPNADVLDTPTHRYPPTGALRLTMKQTVIATGTGTAHERVTWFDVITYFMDKLVRSETKTTLMDNIINKILSLNIDDIPDMQPSQWIDDIITNYYKLLSLSALLCDIYSKCNNEFRKSMYNLLDYCNNYTNTPVINFKISTAAGPPDTVSSSAIFKMYASALQNYNIHVDRMLRLIEDIYNTVVDAIGNYNNVIDTINKIFGYAYIQKYFNLASDTFDTAIGPNIKDFSNQLLTRINHVPLPSNILSTVQLIDSSHYDDTRKLLLQQYGIKQLQKTQPITYTDATKRGDSNSVDSQNPQLGYFAPAPITDFTNAKNTANIFADDLTEYLSMGEETRYDTIASPYNYVAKARIQSSGINIRRDSQDIVYPIVSGVLDTYTYLVKYSTIRLITKEMYNKLTTTTEFDKIKDYINLQMETNNGDNNKLIMTIIVNILNDLFHRFIINATGIAAKKIMEYYYKGLYHASTSQYVTEYIDTNISTIDLIIKTSSYKELYQDIKEEVNKIAADILQTDPDIAMFNQMISNFTDSKAKEQHRILGNDLNSDICFDIDIDAAKALIECGADFTITDVAGNIPLNYAIDIGHSDLVNVLLTSKLRIGTTRNIVGNTPIDHIVQKIHEGIKKLDMNKLLESASKNIDKNIIKKSNYPRILNRSTHILKFVIYLLNHQLTNMELSHFNPDSVYEWTYEDHNELYRILDVGEGGIPLVNSNAGNPDLNTNHVFDRLIQKKTHEKNKIHNTVTGMTNEKNNLEKYSNSLTGTTIPERQKKAQVDEYITLLTQDIASKTAEMNTLDTDINAMIPKKQVVPPQTVIDTLTRYLENKNSYTGTRKSIVHLYEGMFKEINTGKENNVTTDLNSYYKLWESLLSSTGVGRDNTQIPLLCIEQFNNNVHIDTMNGFSIISKFWTNVIVRQIDDYFKLPRTYKKHNYLLDALVDIYKHVMEHTLCANYYVVLFKLLINFVTTRHPDKLQPATKSRDELVKDTMKLILLNNGENKLLKYIMQTLPDLLVRSILNVPKHDNDPIKTADTEKLLYGAVNIILDNTGVTLNASDQLIVNITTYIIPYFAEYFNEYVKESQNIVNNYLKCLHSLAQDMKIYSLVDKKYREEVSYYNS